MKFCLFFVILILSGCSGYRYTQLDNPLAQYGIESLSVPMFYNYSNQPEIANNFTRETYRLLAGFKGLKLKTGYSPEADAVLIGIIRSPEKVAQTLRPNNLRSAQAMAKQAIGESRPSFYIPGSTNINLTLQVIVIKRPTEEELNLFRSGIGEQIKPNDRIIINQLLSLTNTYTREVFDRTGGTDAVAVTATQNAGIQRKVVKNLAEQAANSIRDVILYAF